MYDDTETAMKPLLHAIPLFLTPKKSCAWRVLTASRSWRLRRLTRLLGGSLMMMMLDDMNLPYSWVDTARMFFGTKGMPLVW